MSSTSQPFDLNWSDWKKIGTNAAIFFAPAALVFLSAIQAGYGFKTAMLSVYTWLLNTGVDILKKYVEGTKRDPSGKFTS